VSEPAGPTPEPLFRVVRGNPTDEELAALVTVLSSLSGAVPEPENREVNAGWSAYWRLLRGPIQAGPGGWRASGRSTIS
jgi:hypothetical protein